MCKPSSRGDAPLVVRHGNTVLLARVPVEKCPTEKQLTPQLASATLLGLGLPSQECELPIFDYPHDIVRHHLTSLADNLTHRLAADKYQEIADGVFAAPGRHAGAACGDRFAAGPDPARARGDGRSVLLSAWAGATWARKPRLIEHAALKMAWRLGHTTKIGGESKLRSSSPTATSSITVFWGTATSAVGSTWEPAPATAI